MAAEHPTEIENDSNSDTEDPKQHARLLSAISRLDYKQRFVCFCIVYMYYTDILDVCMCNNNNISILQIIII
jgi:hypothetical protein